MTHLRIALEWFLNPDHLPSLAAREWLQPMADGADDLEAFPPRPLPPVGRSADIWRPMWRYLHRQGGDVVDEQTFEAMFA